MYEFQENIPQFVGAEVTLEFARILYEATEKLKPTLSLGSVDFVKGKVTFQNLIGEGTTLAGERFVIRPKGVFGQDWTSNISRFFTAKTRFYLAPIPNGGTPSIPYAPRADALALDLATELEKGVRKSGPIVAHTFESRVASTLKGKLNVSKWVLNQPTQPTRFPIHNNEVDKQNLYNHVFAAAIRTVLARVESPDARNALLRASRLVTSIPGGQPFPTPSRSFPRLPVQWEAYQRAWNLAEVILSGKTGTAGSDSGFGVSFLVEPWRLLENALAELLELVTQLTVPATPQFQTPFDFLNWSDDATGQLRTVLPDGLLTFAGGARVSFECKYSLIQPGELPIREHAFQTLATANAVGAQAAFLVYPVELPLREVEVRGRTGDQLRFFVIGLGLFDQDIDTQLRVMAAKISSICLSIESSAN